MSINLAWIVSIGIAAGTLWLIYADIRATRSRPQGRPRTMSLPAYAAARWWLLASTPAASIGAILLDHPVLLEVHDRRWLLAAGALIAAAATAVMIAARRQLGRQFTPCYAAYQPTALVTTGLYRSIRHPVYTASMVMLAGLFIASGSLWILLNLALVVGVILWAAPREEQALKAAFPKYTEYVQRTGRFLPPLL